MNNLGYDNTKYDYKSKGITIQWIPQTNKEKINYLIRFLGIDKQVNVFDFSIFIYRIAFDDVFKNCTMEYRKEILERDYNISVSTKTLSKWINRLYKIGEIKKNKDTKTLWKTYYCGIIKIQEPVENQTNNKDYQEYSKERTKLLRNGYKYGDAISALWSQKHIYYYYCYEYEFNAWRSSPITAELFTVIKDYVENEVLNLTAPCCP